MPHRSSYNKKYFLRTPALIFAALHAL